MASGWLPHHLVRSGLGSARATVRPSTMATSIGASPWCCSTASACTARSGCPSCSRWRDVIASCSPICAGSGFRTGFRSRRPPLSDNPPATSMISSRASISTTTASAVAPWARHRARVRAGLRDRSAPELPADRPVSADPPRDRLGPRAPGRRSGDAVRGLADARERSRPPTGPDLSRGRTSPSDAASARSWGSFSVTPSTRAVGKCWGASPVTKSSRTRSCQRRADQSTSIPCGRFWRRTTIGAPRSPRSPCPSPCTWAWSRGCTPPRGSPRWPKCCRAPR